ncbi:hypothetical protein TcCL_Unassigned03652 [Trypanosoma cruzi]|nr:hypothetical protein TcCL_Unassigned03652 [Trypanosoma cruzi]
MPLVGCCLRCFSIAARMRDHRLCLSSSLCHHDFGSVQCLILPFLFSSFLMTLRCSGVVDTLCAHAIGNASAGLGVGAFRMRDIGCSRSSVLAGSGVKSTSTTCRTIGRVCSKIVVRVLLWNVCVCVCVCVKGFYDARIDVFFRRRAGHEALVSGRSQTAG